MYDDKLDIQTILWCCCSLDDSEQGRNVCLFVNQKNRPPGLNVTLTQICSKYCLGFDGHGPLLADRIPLAFRPEYAELAMSIFQEMLMAEYA